MTTTVFRHDWQKVEHGPDWSPSSGRRRPGGRTKAITADSRQFIPPGWPEGVLPPCEADWEQSAVNFLLDCCPADFRGYPLLRRHPVVLARLAAQTIDAQVRAVRDGIANARHGLQDYVEVPVLDNTVDLLHSEEARLMRVRRAVLLVEESLRGRIFVNRL